MTKEITATADWRFVSRFRDLGSKLTILYRKYDDGKEVVLMCPFKLGVLDSVFVRSQIRGGI